CRSRKLRRAPGSDSYAKGKVASGGRQGRTSAAGRLVLAAPRGRFSDIGWHHLRGPGLRACRPRRGRPTNQRRPFFASRSWPIVPGFQVREPSLAEVFRLAGCRNQGWLERNRLAVARLGGEDGDATSGEQAFEPEPAIAVRLYGSAAPVEFLPDCFIRLAVAH